MTTPVRHTDDSQQSEVPLGPEPVAAPLGWLLTLGGAIGLLLASWWIYPMDAPGMWAGYRATLIGTAVILAVLGMKVDLPKAPLLVIAGLGGAATLLWGLLGSDPYAVRLSETIAGAVMVAGVALQVSSPKGLKSL